MKHATQLWLGAILISFAPVFVKLVQNVGPTGIGFYRVLFASLLLLPFFLKSHPQKIPFARKKLILLVLGAGVTFALDLWVWHRSVIVVGAGMGTILGNTQVFYLAVIGMVFFSEPIRSRLFVAIIMAFLGVYLLVNPENPSQVTPLYWWGIAYGLLTGIAYATFLCLVRLIESLAAPFSTAQKLFFISIATCGFLLVISLFEKSLVFPTGLDWLWLLGLALVAQVGGWLLITHNLPKVSVSKVGLILLTQPVGATLWGALLFNESFGFLQFIGAVITLTAIYLATIRNV